MDKIKKLKINAGDICMKNRKENMLLNNVLKLGMVLFLCAVFIGSNVEAQDDTLKSHGRFHPIVVKSLKDTGEVVDLSFIEQYINEVDVVSLGESTHGSSEVFIVKGQLIRYLVEEKGFRVFALEGNMVEAENVNDYILTGTGNPKLLMYNLGYWVWDTYEFLDLLEWMRNYNEKSNSKIHFVGFDMQSYASALRHIIDFNQKEHLIDDSIVNGLDSISNLIKKNIAESKYEMNGALNSAAYPYAVELNKQVERSSQVNCEHFSKFEFIKFKQYCFILKQYFTRYSEEKPSKGYRDYCMAKNINWIKSVYPNKKIIIWAHNGHVKRAEHTMGYFLDLQGIRSYVIGFSTYSGTYTAIDSGGYRSNPLSVPDSNCYEYYFNQIAHPNYFHDLSHMEPGLKKQISGKMFREIGSMKRVEQFYPSELHEEYDAIIHLRDTKSSKLFFN